MLKNEFPKPQSADMGGSQNREIVSLIVFLTPYRNCWAYSQQVRPYDDEAAKAMPRQYGMGTCGFRIVTVDAKAWEDQGCQLIHPDTRQQIEFLTESPRHLYKSLFGEHSYMRTDMIEGDVLVDDAGRALYVVEPKPKLSEVAARLAAGPQ